jgi:hypothetical protein
MTSLQIITVVVLLLCFLLWVFFRIKNKKISLVFSEKINALHSELNTHATQLANRSNGLNRYDFLKYNLSEVLVIQEQIKL